MQTENMKDQQVGGLLGRREFGQGNEVGGFGEPVYNREDGGVAPRWGETCDEVQGYVRPGTTGDG